MADYLAQTMFETADLVRKHGVDVGYANPQAFFYGKAVCGDPESIHGIVTDLTDSEEPKIDWPFFNSVSLHSRSTRRLPGRDCTRTPWRPCWARGPRNNSARPCGEAQQGFPARFLSTHTHAAGRTWAAC
ncbi:hypothetical protein SGPA1_41074 [Streptomyces misionensis JCM 4497]